MENSTAAAQVERERHNALSAMGSCDQLLIKTKGVPKWLCTESAIETNTNGCNLSYYLQSRSHTNKYNFDCVKILIYFVLRREQGRALS